MDAVCAKDATPEINTTITTDEASHNEATNATCVTNAISTIAPKITVGTASEIVATGIACAIDVATSEVATRMNTTKTGTFLAPTIVSMRD